MGGGSAKKLAGVRTGHMGLHQYRGAGARDGGSLERHRVSRGPCTVAVAGGGRKGVDWSAGGFLIFYGEPQRPQAPL